MKDKIIVATPSDLKAFMFDVMTEFYNKKFIENSKYKVITNDEAKKLLKIGDEKLHNLIKNGVITTTAHGKITEYEVLKCLDNQLTEK